MIFSKKEITVAYTVETCNSCKKQNKRKFNTDDVLFAQTGLCKCGGNFFICMIYGESFKQ